MTRLQKFHKEASCLGASGEGDPDAPLSLFLPQVRMARMERDSQGLELVGGHVQVFV